MITDYPQRAKRADLFALVQFGEIGRVPPLRNLDQGSPASGKMDNRHTPLSPSAFSHGAAFYVIPTLRLFLVFVTNPDYFHFSKLPFQLFPFFERLPIQIISHFRKPSFKNSGFSRFLKSSTIYGNGQIRFGLLSLRHGKKRLF